MSPLTSFLLGILLGALAMFLACMSVVGAAMEKVIRDLRPDLAKRAK